MNIRKNHIIVVFLICLGCVPQRHILSPVENTELQRMADKLVFDKIPDEYIANVIFNGAFEGFQCFPKIEDIDTFLEEGDFDKYESYKCICYDYKIRTQQGFDLYIGVENGYYLHTRVCFDSSKSIVEQPKIDNLLLTITQSNTKHLNLSEAKMIAKDKVNHESKVDKFPALVYVTDSKQLIWKIRRYFGRLNVTVHEFDIDAYSGAILKHQEIPFRRTFWQWLAGTGI